MSPKAIPTGPKPLPTDEVVDQGLFQSDDLTDQREHKGRFQHKRRGGEHVRQTVVQNLLVDADDEIVEAETVGRRLTAAERIARYESSLLDALDRLDESTVDQTQRKTEHSRQELKERLAKHDNRLELMQAVTTAELEEDEERQSALKSEALQQIAERLNVDLKTAERLYEYYAQNPEVYRQVIEIELARSILKHEPARIDEFIDLARAGDNAGIEQLIADIGHHNVEFATRAMQLTDHRKTVVLRIAQLEPPNNRIDALLGDESIASQLDTGQQMALAETLAEIDQPVRDSWRHLDFQVDVDGLYAEWLGTNLAIRLTDDGHGSVHMDHIPVLGGIGQDFFRAAIVGHMHQLDDELSVSVWTQLGELVDFVGPGFQTPVEEQTLKAVSILKSLGVHNAAVRNRLGVVKNGSIQSGLCRRLGRQLAVIVSGTGVDSPLVSAATATTVVDHWQQQLARSDVTTVLNLKQIHQLLNASESARDNG